MRKFLLTFAVVSLSALSAMADEGMWMISTLSAHTDSVLRSMGCELTREQLYNVDGKCLNNAILQFDGGCSASVVSPNGLVFTNHHCGYDAIQQHSTVKHDYLKQGFVAKSYKKELPNDGMYVLFHLKTIDVTERLLGPVPDIASKEERAMIIDSIARQLVSEVEDEKNFIEAEVNAFYKGSKFYLTVYQRYNDVRLVCAPPSCLGKYGGDTDNWMWPRQTCDFSVFRIYTDRNGKPANYNKKNIPMQTQNFVHVSTQGYKDGDYCMTLGYPGSTDRYLSSYGIVNTMRTTNDVRYQVRTVKLDIMNEAMRSSDALRIMYASKHAHSSNYWKFSLGQNQALDNLKVVDEKKALEAQIQQWINSDSVAHSKYIGILDSLKVGYERTFNVRFARNMWIETFYSGSDLLGFAIRNSLGGGNADETAEEFQERLARLYKDLDVETDRRIFAALLKNYMEKVSSHEYFPESLHNYIDSVAQGDIDKFANYVYEHSTLAKPEEAMKAKAFTDFANDPFMEIAMDLIPTLMQMPRDMNTYEYERLLGDALREMNHEHEYYPDANFTMRLSYGLCKPIDAAALAAAKAGYAGKGQNGMEGKSTLDQSTLNAQSDKLYTTPSSFLAKHEKNPGELDFEVIDPVYKWMKSGKYSKQYIDPETGELPLCFLTTNDITGGNSGSGMYDGKGRLIGLAFDGNWEAMSGDLKFDNSLQRCIGVDIRYVLSVIGDYLGAKRLIKELVIE